MAGFIVIALLQQYLRHATAKLPEINGAFFPMLYTPVMPATNLSVAGVVVISRCTQAQNYRHPPTGCHDTCAYRHRYPYDEAVILPPGPTRPSPRQGTFWQSKNVSGD